MYSMIRPLLFNLEAETAHHLILSALDYLPAWCFANSQGTSVNAMGLNFPHQVGLAAGLDKNGEHLDALAKLGFSFIELGTVTPKPQMGNPAPRLFRLPKAQAIINRMGFNNQGVDALIAHIKKARFKGILGINIGKNKDTALVNAVEDYRICLQKVYEYASYVTLNISSPNTPDLRQLQQGNYLQHLLAELHAEQRKLADHYQKHVPLVVKISPDEDKETLKEMTEIILNNGIDGIIATNTTCSRDLVRNLPYGEEQGGLSGQPVEQMATDCLRMLKQYTGDAITLIGVGGIDSADVAQKKIAAGASLVQVYTGLIYKGPALVSQIVRGCRSL